MRVRMLVQVSGTREGREWPQRGAEVDLPDAEAQQYVASNMAVPVATFTPEVETAVPPPAPEVEERGPITRRRAAGLSKAIEKPEPAE